MGEGTSYSERFAALGAVEKTAILLSLIAACFLVIDPLVLQAVQRLDPDVREGFRDLTDLGKSSWILLPTGGAIILLHVLRTREIGLRAAAAYGYTAQIFAFVFVSVAGAGIISSLVKNVLGRARPKLFEQVGSFDFSPFAFRADFASFPSGHATTIAAFAAALAILWPRARVVLFVAAGWIAATRFLIGAHYFSDAVAGMLFGGAFPYWLRARLAARRRLFIQGDDGAIRLRGRRAWGWIMAEVRAGLVPRRLKGVDAGE